MHSNRLEIVYFLLVVCTFAGSVGPPNVVAQQANKPFTVIDEIELTLFDDPSSGSAEVLFSPNGKYFAVKTERGRLDTNSVEDVVRIYRTQDVKNYLDDSDQPQPKPVWAVTRTGKEGSVIGGWRWLGDSSGIAFLEPTKNGNHRIVLVNIQKKTVTPLSSETEAVRAFDIRDRQHYVYTVADPIRQEKGVVERNAASVVGTGRSIRELILPKNSTIAGMASSTVSLWAVVGGKHFEVRDVGTPLANFGSFALSPDGNSLLTTLPVGDVPSAWETLYPPPPFTFSKNRIHAGHYDAMSTHVHQFVKVDLQTGSIQPLTNAPIAGDAGWIGAGDPSWSSDGRKLLLPNTFLKSEQNVQSRPCVAVMVVSTGMTTCVEVLKAYKSETVAEEGYHVIYGARFAGDGANRIMVAFMDHEDQAFKSTEYENTQETWQAVRELKGAFPAVQNDLVVSVKEGLNDIPELVAADKQTSRVIFDPNPQLKDIELGQASVYRWKDEVGRDWKGGLYKPVNYKPGQLYPLVIQTHGFSESEFRPSGVFPTAFAARALAAKGIIVLQTAAGASCPIVSPEEGSCAVAMLESAANQLVSDGLVDPERIGIIGFSRTCFSVMEMLTTSSLHLRAASITDGVMEDYLQYLLFADQLSGEADRMIGTPPFGEGLKQWLKRSPGFNLDKVSTPLLVNAEGPIDVLFMWQPYAGLHYLHKPVDFIMLNTDEHVLTNPAVRLASQGGSVDWFRFWLQGYEDPDPAKKEQYERWRGLRKMQEENDAKEKAAKDKAAVAN